MIVDGRAIAAEIYADIKDKIQAVGASPRLAVVACAPTAATMQYLALKERKAAEVGITMVTITLPADASTEVCIQEIQKAAASADSVIVQLPFPSHIDTDAVLAAVPPSHDADALNLETTAVLSPVAAACKEILERNAVTITNKHVTIIGSGRLVGKPAAKWFTEMGAAISVVTKDTADLPYYTTRADVIVSGAGVANLITPEMISDGVIILDAGTSEDGGELRGDASPACGEKASLFTPVPGGIGPVTVALLLRNVVTLALTK